MKQLRLILRIAAVAALAATAACVEQASLDLRPCPCAESGWKCCEAINKCVRAEVVCHKASSSARFFSLRTGARWEYTVTDLVTNEIFKKVQTVGNIEPIPNPPKTEWDKSHVRAFKVSVVSHRRRGLLRVESWQEDTGTSVRRHVERAFENDRHVSDEWWHPSRLRLDESERALTGGPFTDSYRQFVIPAGDLAPVETTENDRWFVDGEETLVLGNAVYPCLVVRRPNGSKVYWFSRGVGKVRELNRGAEREDLVSFSGVE